jgi:hypothetical protein
MHTYRKYQSLMQGNIFDVAARAEREMVQAQYEARLRQRQHNQQNRRRQRRKSGRKYPTAMKVLPGQDGFTAYATELMERAQVLADGDDVRCVGPADAAYDQPYQRTVAYLVHPNSAPDYRLLVAHRTGAGKTLSMLRVLSNFYDDPRPKVAIFPEDDVAANFYKSLMRFANPYRDYVLARHPELRGVSELSDADLDVVVKTLALHGHPRSAGKPGFLAAPLRAFSYRQIGGAALQAMSWFKPQPGCPGTTRGPNMWCDKIVVMDEAHNLIKPNEEKFKHPVSAANLRHAREALARATRTVMVLFTATPMVDSLDDIDAMMAIVKGAGNEAVGDEGFVSAFYGAPSSAYPRVTPDERALPRVVRVELGGDPDAKTSALGAYLDKVLDAGGKVKAPYAALAKRNVYEYTPHHPHHQTRGQFPQDLRGPQAEAVVPKLWRAAEYIERAEGKVIVLTAKDHGFFALDTLLRTNPRFQHLSTMALLGKGIKSDRADWRASVQARGGRAESDIKREFDAAGNRDGQRLKALVLNADAFSEGVDFKDVRHVVLLDVTPKWASVLQRVGRAVRHCSHARLPEDSRDVQTVLMVASLPAYVRRKGKLMDLRGVATADELQLMSVIRDRELIEARMCDLMRAAVDGPVLGPSAGSASCGASAVAPRLPVRITAQDERALERCYKRQVACMGRAQRQFASAKSPDPNRLQQAMELCMADRDDCVEDVLGPPERSYGYNCPPTYTKRQCIYHCRHELGLKGRDMGDCMVRKHRGVLAATAAAEDQIVPADACPSCPDGTEDCLEHCAELGLVHGDLYRCATRTSRAACEHPIGAAPVPPPPPPPPPGMVLNPLTDKYIKRGSARHRQLCKEGRMPPEDCDFPKPRRRKSGAKPKSSAKPKQRKTGAKRKSSAKPKQRKTGAKQTVAQLKGRCKELGVKGYSKWKRDELLARCGGK